MLLVARAIGKRYPSLHEDTESITQMGLVIQSMSAAAAVAAALTTPLFPFSTGAVYSSRSKPRPYTRDQPPFRFKKAVCQGHTQQHHPVHTCVTDLDETHPAATINSIGRQRFQRRDTISQTGRHPSDLVYVCRVGSCKHCPVIR